MRSAQSSQTFRKFHRYLGYFLAGIMMLYACSGIVLIFRKTDFLKLEQVTEYQLDSGLRGQQVIDALNIKGLSVTGETEANIALSSGDYDVASGLAKIVSKDYPVVIKAVVDMHKATHKKPLFFLNISFGVALLFFAVSSFLLFPPGAPALKTGVKVAAGGFLFALLVVVFS